MKTSAFVSCLLAMALAVLAPAARADDKAPAFSVSYAHAGLTEITVKDGKLRYVWHTKRRWDEDKVVELDCLDNYDRHEVVVWLTGKELRRFQDLVARHKAFELDKEYPSAAPPGVASRAAAFQSGLTAAEGDRKHGVTWVGDSKVPKNLDALVNDLGALAKEIERSRRE